MLPPYLKLSAWALLVYLSSFIRRSKIIAVLWGVAVLQSLVGISQFIRQTGADNPDLARTYLGEGGGLLVRAYGTFPHPNVLAGFLVLGLISSYCFFLENFNRKENLFYLALKSTSVFIVILGLALTFSRAGWIASLAASILFFYFAFYLKVDRKKLLLLGIAIAFSALLVFMAFNWAIVPRMTTLNYQNFSVQERLSDYRLAWQLIKEKPLLGHGLTLRMGSRPFHNLYLTITKEIGLIGLALFLLLIFLVVVRNRNSSAVEVKAALAMLGGLLVFGLFDHFLWTLRPGTAMLALVISMLIREKRVL